MEPEDPGSELEFQIDEQPRDSILGSLRVEQKVDVDE
jgi:hypothetical protein